VASSKFFNSLLPFKEFLDTSIGLVIGSGVLGSRCLIFKAVLCCCFVLSSAYICGMTSNHCSERDWCTRPARSHLFCPSLINLSFLDFNSSLNFNGRLPIILQRSHSATIAIIAHERNLHTGPRALLGIVRSQYWPFGGRKSVMKVVNKCIRCFRMKPRVVEHIMADLPKERSHWH